MAWNEHVLNVKARIDKESKDGMMDTVRDIFTEGEHIDFTNKENLRGLKELADMMRKMFAAAGNTKIDFSAMMKKNGPELFDGLKEAAKEFESVWNSIVSKFGTYGLKDIFMQDASALSSAFGNINKDGKVVVKTVQTIQKAFDRISWNNPEKLLTELQKTQQHFSSADNIDWETQYADLLRYIHLYEKYMKNPDADLSENIRKQISQIGPYTYQQLKEVEAHISTSLQNIFNFGNNKPLLGLTDGGKINVDVVPVVIKTLDVGDILGESTKRVIEVPIEFKAKLEEYHTAKAARSKEIENEIAQLFPEEIRDKVIERLQDFQMVENVRESSYKAVYKSLLGFGMQAEGGSAFSGIGASSVIDDEFKNKLVELQNAYAGARLKLAHELEQEILSKVPENLKDTLKKQLQQDLSKSVVKDADYNNLWSKFGQYWGSGSGTGAGGGIGDGSGVGGDSIDDQLKETIALLEKEKLTYEDVLALVKEYNNESKMQEFAKAGNWDEYDKIFAHHADIARKLVPDNMLGMGSDSPDKWLATVGMSAEDAAQRLKGLYDRLHQVAGFSEHIEEAYKKLEEFSHPTDISDQAELNRVYEARLAIIQAVGEENLKAHDPARYKDWVEEWNESFENRSYLMQLDADGEVYERLNSELDYNNEILVGSEKLEALLANRQALMKDINLTSEEEYLEQEEINKQIERRIALQKELEPLVASGALSHEDYEDILAERGELEERQRQLDGVQQNLFNAEPEDLNEAQAVLDQYERILVKTASGKTLTLGPEMSEDDWKSFMKIDIDKVKSIEFVRKAIQQETNDINTQNNALQENANLKGKPETQGGSGQTEGATAEEVENLEKVRAKVAEITTAIEAKTTAFKTEGTEVGNVVDGEIAKLTELENKVTAVKTTLEGLLNNIKSGADDVGAGLNNITVNVSHKEDDGAKQPQETWALEDTLRNKTNGLLGKIAANTDAIKANTKDVAKDSTLKQVLNALNTKMKTASALSGQSSGNQPVTKPSVTNAGGNLLKMYERLGALGAQKNALDLNSDERKGIKEKIKLLKEEIDKKRRLVIVDKQLIIEAQKKGAADQKAQAMTVGGRKSDVQAAKDEKKAVNDLLKAYEHLGELRANRDALPKGAQRDKLQKEIKLETARLWKQSKKLGVDSAQTGDASALGVHNVQMDQLLAKTKELGQYEKDIVSMKKGSEAYNNAENRIKELNSEIALIQKKITLTQEEKLELDALIKKNSEAVQAKLAAQNDTASAERASKIKRLAMDSEKLAKLQAASEVENSNKIQEQIQLLKEKVDEKRKALSLTDEENTAIDAQYDKVLEEERRILSATKVDKTNKKQAANDKAIAKKAAMMGRASGAVSRAENVWMTAQGIDKSLSGDVIGKVNDLYDKLVLLRKEQNRINKAEVVSGDQQKELRDHTIEINSLTSEIQELLSEYEKLSGDNVANLGVNTLGPDAKLNDYKAQLSQAILAKYPHAQIKEFDAATKTLSYTLKTGKNEFTDYTAAVRRADNALVSVQGATKKSETFFESTMRKMKEISSYMSGMTIISRTWQEIRRGVQYVKEIDDALLELRKVTDETEETYSKFLDTAAKTGAKLGATITAVTDATATFAKLGYTIEEATEMAESAIVYKNVGDNIESTEDAADSIISTMKGFGLEATESMRIVDRFNEVKFLPPYTVMYMIKMAISEKF